MQALLVVGIQFTTHTPEIYGFSRTLALARLDIGWSQVREVPVILLCRRKGLSLARINLDAVYIQLYRFTPRRFRLRLVPQWTQGLQASTKGTMSLVFTGPPASILRDLVLLRLSMTIPVP